MSLAEKSQQLVNSLRNSQPLSLSANSEEDSLIGIFQAFRPDGIPKTPEWESYPGALALHARLQAVYEAVGCGRRADNMKDAYFVVRNPPLLDLAVAEQKAQEFTEQAMNLASALLPDVAFSSPVIRLLEGKAPKHPKQASERSRLLQLFDLELPQAIDALFSADELGATLADPLYFISCDRWLRDFLRWPLLPEATREQLGMPSLDGYFELWRHGIKFRIFNETQIDFYLPRRSDGSLIQAGQFARS